MKAGLPEDRLIEKLQSSIDQWNGEVTTAHESLTRQIRDTRGQLQTLLEILARRKNLPAPRQHALPAPEIETRITELEDDIRQLREERDRALSRVETVAAERDHAREELERLRSRNGNRPGALEAARAEIETLQAALEDKNNKLRQEQARHTDLQLELESAVARQEESGRRLEKSHQEIDSANFALAHLQETLGEVNALHLKEKAASEKKIQDLQGLTQQKIAELEARAEMGNDDELQTEINRLRTRIEEFENDGDAEIVEAIAIEDSGVVPVAATDDGRLQELEQREQALAEREAHIQNAAARMQHLEETALLFQEQLTALEAERAEAGSNGTAVPAAEIETRDDTIRDLQKHIQSLDRRVMQAEKQNEFLPKQLDNALRELDQARATIAEKNNEIEVLRGRIDPEASPAVREEAERIERAAFGPDGTHRSLGVILLDAGIINQNQLQAALDEQKVAKKRRLGSILVEKGLVREEIVAQVVARQLRVPYVHIPNERIEPAAVGLLNGRLATHHMCFPLRATSSEITVAMANPLDLIAIEDLEIATSLKVKPAVATLADISAAIVRHYGVNITPTHQDRFDTPAVTPQTKPANTQK